MTPLDLTPSDSRAYDDRDGWRVRKIVVVGAGTVGMPMAALLARARVRIGVDAPAQVVVLQRRSPSSGWKVDAINAGQSTIGGLEPELEDIVRQGHDSGLLRASDDYAEVRDADVILVCVQTDKRGDGPEYGPLFDALSNVAIALTVRTAAQPALVIIESTLAPSSMHSVVRDLFAHHGLVDGVHILLGNSPHRLMPGRLVRRIEASDKLVGGLDPRTPVRIAELYEHIVTHASIERTNSLTAEVVKTVENAYRDVRIAYAAEVARYCDRQDIDFFALRDAVNRQLAQEDDASQNAGTVPIGGLLVPTAGVGGHHLPTDGVLLWWRAQESGVHSGRSLILQARRINDASPAYAVQFATRAFGQLGGKRAAIFGVAYRPDSDDTRYSPGFVLANALASRGCSVTLHDPHVRIIDQTLLRSGLRDRLTRDIGEALAGADVAFLCVAHQAYRLARDQFLSAAGVAVVDACNILSREDRAAWTGTRYVGVGQGRQAPNESLVDAVAEGFRLVERGVANEVAAVCRFLNERYARTRFDRIDFHEVQRLAAGCPTGCVIANPGAFDAPRWSSGFRSTLVNLAVREAEAAA
jgi:UDP-N-acetyl-D-mannosaminuronic acid dehydrogenase